MAEKFLRLTPYKKEFTLDTAVQLIERLGVNEFVVSEEDASRRHYHIYLKTDYSNERLRYQLKKYAPVEVYISGKDVMDKIATIAYTIKDGKYKTKNIDINTFLMAQQKSHKKESFDNELKLLIQSGETSTYIITEQIIDLYIKYNRKIYLQHVSALVRTILASNDNDYRKRLIHKIVSEI